MKGKCILSFLKYYCPIKNTCIDYMHSILEGVIKNFFHYWFDSKYSSLECSLRGKLVEIDQRILSIKPPSYVQISPRSIYDYANWRAKEYLVFILLYAIPVFHKIMPTVQFNNLTKLIIFLEFLLQPKMKRSVLFSSNYQELIQSFLSELSELYHKNIMLSGAHELLHFIDITREFGPINLNNCFAYEEMNRKAIRMINGMDLIGEEFINVFSGLQILGQYLNNSNNKNDLIDYAEENFIIKTTNKKCLNKMKRLFKINDNIELSREQSKFLSIKNLFNREINISKISHLVTFNGIRYNSLSCLTKFSDCFFQTEEKIFGCIDLFFVENDIEYVYAKRINSLDLFETEKYKSATSLCTLSKTSFFIIVLRFVNN